jgi:hypothetical protein
MTDEPLVLQPVVRKLELEAISLYRAKFPEGPLWQDLANTTRHVWVVYAEVQRTAGVSGAPYETDSDRSLKCAVVPGVGACLTCAANHYCPEHNPAPPVSRNPQE